MVVVSVTDCPPKLRGDLSKWLIEINAGVYVGRVNARVREKLWKHVTDNLSTGRATMVFETVGEQGYDFHVHNTSWIPVDFDGLKLMCRLAPAQNSEAAQRTFQSNASVQRKSQRIAGAKARKQEQEGYIALDLETTGLDFENDVILEIAALRIVNHQVANSMQVMVKTEREIPLEIQRMTGITPEMVQELGVPLGDALRQLSAFAQGSPIVSHNASFDRRFLHDAFLREGLSAMKNPYTDTLRLARRYLDDVPNYQLGTLAEHFGLPHEALHRAMEDCQLVFQLFEKLNENGLLF